MELVEKDLALSQEVLNTRIVEPSNIMKSLLEISHKVEVHLLIVMTTSVLNLIII